MQQDLIPFAFEDHLVRVFDRDGEPWFVLADVCRVLEIADTGTAARRLDDDEKGVHSMHTLGGPQGATIINESGLYSLVLTSRKPAAKRFKKWVTGTVLPSIRRTGHFDVRDSGAIPDAGDLGPLSDLSSRCRLVEITERLSGKDAARALWRHLGLPWVSEMEPRGAVFAQEDDAVARFAMDGIEKVRGVVTPAAMLWPAFCAFCLHHDLVNPGEKSFFTRFGRLGLPKRKTAGRSVYQNIRPRGAVDGVGEGRAE